MRQPCTSNGSENRISGFAFDKNPRVIVRQSTSSLQRAALSLVSGLGPQDQLKLGPRSAAAYDQLPGGENGYRLFCSKNHPALSAGLAGFCFKIECEKTWHVLYITQTEHGSQIVCRYPARVRDMRLYGEVICNGVTYQSALSQKQTVRSTRTLGRRFANHSSKQRLRSFAFKRNRKTAPPVRKNLIESGYRVRHALQLVLVS